MTVIDTRILLIDDDSGDAFLVNEALQRIDRRNYTVTHASSVADAETRLADSPFDVILLDLNLAESNGIDTLRRLQLIIERETPVIVLTGLEDEDTALELLVEGAADFLRKSELKPETLSRSIQYTLRRQSLLGELHSTNVLLKQKNTRLAQRFDAAQQFVDNVSHEFRTPLTVIREYCSIVRDGLDGPVNAKQSDHLEKILHRTDDLALMVDDMLDVSKLGAGLLAVWRQPCDIVDLIAEVETMIRSRAAARGVQFRVDLADDLPEVYCDAEKARRVIINLAINAIKFTPAGGSVRLWSRAECDGIVVGVTDTGAGISQSNLEEIFKRFRQVDTEVRSSTKGFGLGLSIAKDLVELNMGEINVESKVGSGSTFTFTLPPNNLESIVDRYLSRIAKRVHAPAEVSVLTVRVDDRFVSKVDGNAGGVVDEFVQRTLRGNDLTFRASANCWLLLTHCPALEVADLIGRVESDWRAFVRNCPAAELPELICEVHGSWQFPDERQGLKRAALLNTESIFVHDDRDARKYSSVLVVDDNADVRSCMTLRLQAAGYQVLTALDGESGISMALEHRPDAIVLDVRMPNRDGISVLHELRANAVTKKTPIVMLSASIGDQHGALNAGANFFVPKPYSSSDVLAAIETSMQQGADQPCEFAMSH